MAGSCRCPVRSKPIATHLVGLATIGGLTSGTAYRVRVVAVNSADTTDPVEVYSWDRTAEVVATAK